MRCRSWGIITPPKRDDPLYASGHPTVFLPQSGFFQPPLSSPIAHLVSAHTRSNSLPFSALYHPVGRGGSICHDNWLPRLREIRRSNVYCSLTWPLSGRSREDPPTANT